ncbi:MAG: cytidylate kinase-like family protein [Synergistaceae bacterium]|jgi:cytidylate kinase|nr:cytidylate kinase-like family protein [Synergistaceae bacterium]
MDDLVITIGREFGSGGRQVGEKLAEELGIGFYDKSLIHLAVAKSGLDPITIEKAEEEATSRFLFYLAIGGYVSSGIFSQVNIPISDQVYFAQSKAIEELASQGSCVIIGRCANYILRNHPKCVKVFIYGSVKDKLRRIVEEYGIPREEAESKMTKMDKGRANYYQHYTDEVWGNVRSYDLAINTSSTGIDGAVTLIQTLVKNR